MSSNVLIRINFNLIPQYGVPHLKILLHLQPIIFNIHDPSQSTNIKGVFFYYLHYFYNKEIGLVIHNN